MFHSLGHASRLKPYDDSEQNITKELKDSIDHTKPRFNTVKILLDLLYTSPLALYEVQALWRDLSHEEPTSEPFQILQGYIPKMLQNFTSNFRDQEIVKRAQDS